MADDLDHVGATALGKFICGLACRKVAAVLNVALDKLVCLEALFRLCDDAVVNIPAADVDAPGREAGEPVYR